MLETIFSYVHVLVKRMADILHRIEIFYSNPCSRPLVNKGHIPIQICSQAKILDDILLGW